MKLTRISKIKTTIDFDEPNKNKRKINLFGHITEQDNDELTLN